MLCCLVCSLPAGLWQGWELQRSTVGGLRWAGHCSSGYRFPSRSKQVTCRSREPEPQLREHWKGGKTHNIQLQNARLRTLAPPPITSGGLHQSPLAGVPAGLWRASGHLTGLDGEWAEQTAAEGLLQLQATRIHAGDLPGLLTCAAGDRTLPTEIRDQHKLHVDKLLLFSNYIYYIVSK